MFDRDLRAEADEVLAFVGPPGEDSAIVVQAIDTVARRLVKRRVDVREVQEDWEEFADVGEYDWERVQARAQELVHELDRGQGPFEAAYNLLKARAEQAT